MYIIFDKKLNGRVAAYDREADASNKWRELEQDDQHANPTRLMRRYALYFINGYDDPSDDSDKLAELEESDDDNED